MFEGAVQIIHNIINHEAGFAFAEILRGRRKNTPGRTVLFGRAGGLFPPEHGPAVALAYNAQILGVPSPKSFGVLRFKKDSADSAHSSHRDPSYATIYR